jgi:formylglycine-generating enzyme required for sulfatase activity
MAPEAFKGQRSIQTDTWAAGVLFYQLLTGRLPFTGDDWPSLMHAVINDPYLPLPASAPAPLPAGIDRALQKDPAQRFQSAAEMRQALLKAAQPAPTQLEPQPTPPSPQPSRNRGKYAAAGVVLALAIGLVMFLNRNSPAPANASSEAKPLSLAPTPTSIVADSPTLPASQTAALKSFTEDLGNDVKVEMVKLSGGTFLMGSPSKVGWENEHPQHSVTISPFYIGKYEVTQAQWKAVMGKNNNPSNFKGDNLPVEMVSWNDAVEFCKKLSERTGRTYRLPTEAEWEYAARAGSTGPYSFGDDFNRLGDYAWFGGNSGSKTHPVGQKKSNDWGLYDMHGNVWEWVQDWHDDGYYRQSVNSVDPQGPSSGATRGLRGDAWGDGTYHTWRTSHRSNDLPSVRGSNYGFRLASAAKTR